MKVERDGGFNPIRITLETEGELSALTNALGVLSPNFWKTFGFPMNTINAVSSGDLYDELSRFCPDSLITDIKVSFEEEED